MRTGDKVRFLHSKGEGIIRKVIDAKNVEVEIEDGFLIPALKSDLVIVSADESKTGTAAEEDSIAYPQTNGGLWIAFIPFNDKTFSIYIINDTPENALFTIGEENEDGHYSGLTHGVLKPGNTLKFTEASTLHFDKWPSWIVQSMFFREGRSEWKQPLIKKMQFKASTFFKSKQTVPVLKKEGHAFRLDTGAVKVNPEQVVEQMFKSPAEDTIKVSRPAREIDLHIEKLVSNHAALSNSQILKMQMDAFEKNLENAIATGMEEIIFIHGVGNGVLREQIHKALSKNKLIRFFKDAQKEKFGYGATQVRLK